MDSFLTDFGFFAICFLVVYLYKKILEYHDLKRLRLHEDEKIYKAAEEFAHKASSDDVKKILSNCFTEKNAEKILSQAFPHRTDKDGGYRAFIRSVNKVLGENVYSEQCHTH